MSNDQKPSDTWTMEQWRGFYEGTRLVMGEVAESLIRTWICRHCGHASPVITEICDACGVMDDTHGAGEELEKDKEQRLKGQRFPTGIWTQERCAGLARDLIK